MLYDVQLRLANQHKKCLTMFQGLTVPDRNKQASVPASREKRKIRAVNQPMKLNIKQWDKRKQILEKARGDVLRDLKNLEILHADTFVVGTAEQLSSCIKDPIQIFYVL